MSCGSKGLSSDGGGQKGANAEQRDLVGQAPSAMSSRERSNASKAISMALGLLCCRRPPDNSLPSSDIFQHPKEEEEMPEVHVRVFLRVRQADLVAPTAQPDDWSVFAPSLTSALCSTFARVHWKNAEDSWREVGRTPTDWMSGEQPVWDYTCPAQLFRLSRDNTEDVDSVSIEVFEESLGGFGDPTSRGVVTMPVADLIDESSVQSEMGSWGSVRSLNLHCGDQDAGTVSVCVCLVSVQQQTLGDNDETESESVGGAIFRIRSIKPSREDRDHGASSASSSDSEEEGDDENATTRVDEESRTARNQAPLGELGERLEANQERARGRNRSGKGAGTRIPSIGQASTRGSSGSDREAPPSVSRRKELCETITSVASMYARSGTLSGDHRECVLQERFFRIMLEDAQRQTDLDKLYQLSSGDMHRKIEDAKLCQRLKLAYWLSEASWRKGDPPESVILLSSIQNVRVQADGLTLSIHFDSAVQRLLNRQQETADTNSWWIRFSTPGRTEAWRLALRELTDIARRPCF